MSKKESLYILSPQEIRSIRESLGETRKEFASHFGVGDYRMSIISIQFWEVTDPKKNRVPSPSAMKILYKLREQVYDLKG